MNFKEVFGSDKSLAEVKLEFNAYLDNISYLKKIAKALGALKSAGPLAGDLGELNYMVISFIIDLKKECKEFAEIELPELPPR